MYYGNIYWSNFDCPPSFIFRVSLQEKKDRRSLSRNDSFKPSRLSRRARFWPIKREQKKVSCEISVTMIDAIKRDIKRATIKIDLR